MTLGLRTPLARERARAQLAEKQAAQRAREKANEDDLVAFFTHAEHIDAAAEVRDAAVAAVQRTYDDTVAAAHTAQAARLRAMADRGEKVEDLAELTSLSPTEVRKALKTRPAAAPAAPTDTAAGQVAPAAEPGELAS